VKHKILSGKPEKLKSAGSRRQKLKDNIKNKSREENE
jgi:hypothetical protein